MLAVATDIRKVTLTSEAYNALANLYCDKLDSPSIVHAWNHSVANSPLRRVSPVVRALVYFRGRVPMDGGIPYGEFLDKVGYYRGEILTTPQDYAVWFSASEMKYVDSTLSLLKTEDRDKLGEAMLVGQDKDLLESREGTSLNLEGIKEMAACEAAIIGRWRLEYGML